MRESSSQTIGEPRKNSGQTINWFLLALVYFSLFVYGLIDNSRGPIFPDLLKTYSINDETGAMFFFFASLTSVVSYLGSFWWLKRWGNFRSFQIFSVIQVIALLIMGVFHAYSLVLLGAAIFGLSTGGLGILVNTLVTDAVPSRWHRQALAGLHCMYGVSSLLAPFMVTMWMSDHQGMWPMIFIGLAGASLIVVILSLKPKSALAPVSLKDPIVDTRDFYPHPPSHRRTLWYAATFTAYVVAEIALSSRLALYARRDLGFSSSDANFLLAMFFFCLFIGRLGFALIRVPLTNSRILWLSASMSLLLFSMGIYGNPIWLSFTGFAMAPFYPVFMTLVGEDVGAERASGVIAWALAIENVGLTLMHWSMGILADRYGLARALWVGPACLALGLVLLGIYQLMSGKRALSREKAVSP